MVGDLSSFFLDFVADSGFTGVDGYFGDFVGTEEAVVDLARHDDPAVSTNFISYFVALEFLLGIFVADVFLTAASTSGSLISFTSLVITAYL